MRRFLPALPVLAAAIALVPAAATASSPPPPVLGKTANVAPVSGTTLYRLPGTSAFVTLTEPTQVPLGTELDTTNGRVLLTFGIRYGKTEHAQWWQGRFLIGQRKGKRPVGTQTLSGPLVCPARSFAAKSKRSLWGKGKGRFKTTGKNASAAVRGTWWLTEDTCAGTLVRVKRGVVDVYDFKKREHVLVHAGHSYFAKR